MREKFRQSMLAILVGLLVAIPIFATTADQPKIAFIASYSYTATYVEEGSYIDVYINQPSNRPLLTGSFGIQFENKAKISDIDFQKPVSADAPLYEQAWLRVEGKPAIGTIGASGDGYFAFSWKRVIDSSGNTDGEAIQEKVFLARISFSTKPSDGEISLLEFEEMVSKNAADYPEYVEADPLLENALLHSVWRSPTAQEMVDGYVDKPYYQGHYFSGTITPPGEDQEQDGGILQVSVDCNLAVKESGGFIRSYDPKKPTTIFLYQKDQDGKYPDMPTKKSELPTWKEASNVPRGNDRKEWDELDKDGQPTFSGNRKGTDQYLQKPTVKADASGTYRIVISKDGHLPYTLEDVKVEGEITFPEITLIPGDLDNSGATKLSDRNILLGFLNRTLVKTGGPGSDTHIMYDRADINGDGAVTLADLAILMHPDHYNKKANTPTITP